MTHCCFFPTNCHTIYPLSSRCNFPRARGGRRVQLSYR